MAEVSFGEWLKRQRGAQGWTQGQLAHQLNCSTSALRKMEAEDRRPSVQIIQQLAEIFKIPKDEHKLFLHFARGDSQVISGLDGETEDMPWRISQIPYRSNLPVSTTSFIGREKEQNQVIGLIVKNRIVTVAGAGGVGKTRLVQQVGQKLRNNYSDGVWFVSLDSISDPTLVASAIAAVLDIREGFSDRPLLERLTYSLRAKTTLLLLDNCEHLLESCAQLITTLLTHCPNLKVLTTSREILNMEGESIYYVPSLALPEQDERSIKKISEHESIQLFTERAALVRSSFHLTSHNIQTTVNICRRVDGIPLAIEMAAARVDILKVDEILRQLNQCFELLIGKSRTAPLRHQTMRASMDWSWGLLTEAERRLMRQLSIFAGGWTLDSAQTVCDGDVLNLTSALVKKSLIVVNQDTGRETRYRFHEIVRQYSYEKLVEAGEEANIRTNHLKYFLQFSEQAETALRGSAQMDWYARLEFERDNIRAALVWADESDVETALYILGNLDRFWDGFALREGSYWLSKFLDKQESLAYPRARAKALQAHAAGLIALQQFDTMLSEIEECLALYRSVGDQRGEIDALLLLGCLTHVANNLERNQQALDLALSIGDAWRQARALSNLGGNYIGAKRFAYWEKAIKLFRKSGDWRSLKDNLSAQAFSLVLDDDIELAQKYVEEAELLRWSNKSTESELLRWSNKGTGVWADLATAKSIIASLHGDYHQANLLLQKILLQAEETGNRMNYLWAHVRLGYVAVREGNLNEARIIFAKTVPEFVKDAYEIGVVFSLEGIAQLYVALSKLEHAARLVGWADAMREKIPDRRLPFEQADVDKIIAACLEKTGEVAFSDAYDEGQKMSLEEAVAFALEEN